MESTRPLCSTVVQFGVDEEVMAYLNITTHSTVMALGTNLPPKPNTQLCHCMMRTIECTINPQIFDNHTIGTSPAWRIETYDASEKEVMEHVCLQNMTSCLGLQRNTTNGEYGAFSVCNSTERASWAVDQFYKSHNESEESCKSVGGLHKKKEPTKSLPQACNNLLRQAGSLGTGQVTFIPLLEQNQENSSEPDGKSGHHLPTEAKAGIGIGLGILFVLLAIGGLFFRRQAKRRKKKTSSSPRKEEFDKPELPDNAVSSSNHPPTEIDGNEKLELEANERVELRGVLGTELEGTPLSEIDTQGELIELPAPSYQPVESETSIKS
jgi:hypothetical protein